jgi:type IX secretion system protein PorV
MSLLKRTILLFCLYLIAFPAIKAQVAPGQIVSNASQQVITTAVPFLRINPDARAGGMGDIGIATPVDANGVYANPAKMAFIGESSLDPTKPNDYGFAMSFSPWLKALVNDIYLASLNGYYRVKKEQTISFSLRYFSLGNIQFTDAQGQNTQQFMPREFAVDVHYSRILGKYFSIAASLRYVYSNLASGQSVDGNLVKPGQAGSGDISWYFHKKFNESGAIQHEFSCGMNVSNIGSKMSYTSSVVKDFIPTNMGIGLGYTAYLDKHNSVGVYSDINKLLVPSPNNRVDSATGQYYWREESSIKGMFTSFGDAPLLTQLREYTLSIGAEYYYNRQFGVRTGYFYEPYVAGGRQFLEAGLTVKYSVVALHFSYLIPTTILRNPLDNTLRFSLIFDFAKGGIKKAGESGSGISFIDDTPKKKADEPKKDASPAGTQPAQTTPTTPSQPQLTPDQQPQQTTPDNTTPATPK